jgi:hypothetical protein
VADTAAGLEALTGGSYVSGLTTGALSGKRVAISSTAAPSAAVLTALTAVGATTVTKTVGTPSPNTASIVTRSFEKDLNAYLAGTSGGAGSLQGIVNYNTANPVEGLKYQQGQLLSALSPDLSALAADTAAGKASNAAVIDALFTDTDVVVVPSGNGLVNIADRAGYPVLTVPAGYGTGSAGRNPIGVTFVGKPNSEAALLAAGYAFEQATNVRLAPSFTNPSMFRCVPGSTFFSPHHCHPGDLQSAYASGPTETPVAGDVGGTVPATLSLTLGTPATFGAFTPGSTKSYAASTTATVISTAGDATLSVADPSTTAPGRLVNGTFALPTALKAKAGNGPFATVGSAAAALLTYSGPISNDVVTLTFQQDIASTDALRTGAYSKILTYTLSTTTP